MASTHSVPTRRFGRTGLAMPVFTCGGMRYQHSWKDADAEGITEDGQKNLEATVERALALGITHIETARNYGTSEVQLGRILPRFDRSALIVQTKVSPESDGPAFRERFELSMRNLRLSHVDLLSLHGINTREILKNSLAPGGPLDAARELQREGRARFIGFSTHGPTDVIVDALRTGEFDYVNLHWYWVNTINTPAIHAAAERDLGVFIISPNDKGGKLYAPPEKLARLCAPLSPMAFNNLFCLRDPRVHTLSVGAARPSDFDEHVCSLDHLPQADSWVDDISSRLRAEMESCLGAEWLRTWQEGIPPWSDCPGEVNVWEIVRLWNYATALDMVDFASMRYNLLGQAGHWFPGRNAAEFDEEAMRAALRHSPHVEKIPGILREAHSLLGAEAVRRLSET